MRILIKNEIYSSNYDHYIYIKSSFILTGIQGTRLNANGITVHLRYCLWHASKFRVTVSLSSKYITDTLVYKSRVAPEDRKRVKNALSTRTGFMFKSSCVLSPTILNFTENSVFFV